MKTLNIGQRVYVNNEQAVIVGIVTINTYKIRILDTGEEQIVHKSSLS